jgi:hypothetical protein
MRTIKIWSVVVALLAAVLLVDGVRAQRVGPEAITRTPTQVEVTNFPAVQAVSGTVNVGNLPAVQQVAGTVSVGNLPIDNAGRLLVSAVGLGSTGALTLHSTVATFTGDLGGRTGATQKCRTEFPNSHFATEEEIRTALPARGIVWLTSETDWSWVDTITRTSVNCFEWRADTNTDGSRIDGDLIRAKGTDLFNGGPCSDLHPLICAE